MSCFFVLHILKFIYCISIYEIILEFCSCEKLGFIKRENTKRRVLQQITIIKNQPNSQKKQLYSAKRSNVSFHFSTANVYKGIIFLHVSDQLPSTRLENTYVGEGLTSSSKQPTRYAKSIARKTVEIKTDLSMVFFFSRSPTLNKSTSCWV